MDTLIYFGTLDEIVLLMARNLKPGGSLILTTEKLPEKDDANGVTVMRKPTCASCSKPMALN